MMIISSGILSTGDPQARAFVKSIHDDGYDASETEKDAINELMINLKGKGNINKDYDLFAKIPRLLPLFGRDTLNVKKDLIGLNNSSLSGPWNITDKYSESNGSTAFLNSLYPASSNRLGFGFTTYEAKITGTGSHGIWHFGQTLSCIARVSAGIRHVMRGVAAGAPSSDALAVDKYIHAFRISDTQRMAINNTQSALVNDNITPTSNINIHFGCLLANDDNRYEFIAEKFTTIFITDNMSLAEAQMLRVVLNNFNTKLGR
jgi:hypothetical protein